jgi:hypothetical protein
MLLGGCATTYTVDDGRPVDETLLAQIRTWGEGERALRPAVVKSAELHDPNCPTQWETPFAWNSSYEQPKANRVAWVRGLGLDEHLRIVATSPGFPAAPGDVIAAVGEYASDNAVKMAARLRDARDAGQPFSIKLGSGAVVEVTPFKVCRGRVAFAWPGKYANAHLYHWEASVHPEEAASIGLTPAEAEWIVLWTQGLSEQGGPRMKTFSYSMLAAKTIAREAINVATFGAGSSAATASTTAITSAAITSITTQAVEVRAAKTAAQMTAAAAADKARLTGLDWVAGTVFDRADKWAFERMRVLGMDPTTGLELQGRLAKAGATSNALIFDDERLRQMNSLVASMQNSPDGIPVATNQATQTASSPHRPGTDTPAGTP